MTSTLRDISALLDKADRLEREERENPQPKISYLEFIARRQGISVEEIERRAGL